MILILNRININPFISIIIIIITRIITIIIDTISIITIGNLPTFRVRVVLLFLYNARSNERANISVFTLILYETITLR